jgi:uncharacterized protein with PIN domain
MIVVDASALIAILDKEPDAALYAEAIAEADPPLISTATLLEVNIVMLNRHGVKAARMVDRLIKEAGFRSKVSRPRKPSSHAKPTLATARANKLRVSTTATVFPMR